MANIIETLKTLAKYREFNENKQIRRKEIPRYATANLENVHKKLVKGGSASFAPRTRRRNHSSPNIFNRPEHIKQLLATSISNSLEDGLLVDQYDSQRSDYYDDDQGANGYELPQVAFTDQDIHLNWSKTGGNGGSRRQSNYLTVSDNHNNNNYQNDYLGRNITEKYYYDVQNTDHEDGDDSDVYDNEYGHSGDGYTQGTDYNNNNFYEESPQPLNNNQGPPGLSLGNLGDSAPSTRRSELESPKFETPLQLSQNSTPIIDHQKEDDDEEMQMQIMREVIKSNPSAIIHEPRDEESCVCFCFGSRKKGPTPVPMAATLAEVDVDVDDEVTYSDNEEERPLTGRGKHNEKPLTLTLGGSSTGYDVSPIISPSHVTVDDAMGINPSLNAPGGSCRALKRTATMERVLKRRPTTESVRRISTMGETYDFESNPQTLKIEHLISMGGQMGEGASAVVVRALHMPMCKLYALKQTFFNQKHLLKQELENQAWIKESIPHVPQLLQFHECFLLDETEQLVIVMDLMDLGSIYDCLIKRQMKFSIEQIRHIARESTRGLHALHYMSQPVLHRDIKPHNILISTNGSVKVADFGISTILDNMHQLINKEEGTKKYSSPERHENSYGLKSDIWALGITLIETTTGEMIFEDDLDYFKIKHDPNNIPKLDPNVYPPDLCDFINMCLIIDPKERWSARELINHPFINVNTTNTENPGFEGGGECKEDLEEIVEYLCMWINQCKQYDDSIINAFPQERLHPERAQSIARWTGYTVKKLGHVLSHWVLEESKKG